MTATHPPHRDRLTRLGSDSDSDTATCYHRDRDGTIWAYCWGHWSQHAPAEAAANILAWPPCYREDVAAAGPDAEWAVIERRRIAQRERLAAAILG